jgi:hypothetical protein
MTGIDYEDLCYTVTEEIAVPGRFAFEFLAEASNLAQWTLGMMSAEQSPSDQQTITGKRLFGGTPIIVKIDTDPRRFIVDYLIGSDADSMTMRNSARVVLGEHFGRGKDKCLVSLANWRSTETDDRRWHRAAALHDLEIDLLKERIEQRWRSK